MRSIGRDKNIISTAFTVKGCGKWKTGACIRWQALDTDFCRIREETRKCSIYLHKNWIFTDVLFPITTLKCLLPLHFFKTCMWKYVSGRNFIWGKKETLEFSWLPLLCCNSLWSWPAHWLGQRKEEFCLGICGLTCLQHFPVWHQHETRTENDHLPSIAARNKPGIVKLIVPWFARQSYSANSCKYKDMFSYKQGIFLVIGVILMTAEMCWKANYWMC